MTMTYPPLAADTAALLSQAVHKNNAWTMSGLSERLFTRVFSGLVYAQIWEDPIVDLEALQLTSDSHVITIASGGCNALSYLTAAPAEVIAIDLNATHVALNRLKKAAAAKLEFVQFRAFLEGSSQNVQFTFTEAIAPELDEATRRFWNGRDRVGRRRINVLLGISIGQASWADLSLRLTSCRTCKESIRATSSARRLSTNNEHSSTSAWPRCSSGG